VQGAPPRDERTQGSAAGGHVDEGDAGADGAADADHGADGAGEKSPATGIRGQVRAYGSTDDGVGPSWSFRASFQEASARRACDTQTFGNCTLRPCSQPDFQSPKNPGALEATLDGAPMAVFGQSAPPNNAFYGLGNPVTAFTSGTPVVVTSRLGAIPFEARLAVPVVPREILESAYYYGEERTTTVGLGRSYGANRRLVISDLPQAGDASVALLECAIGSDDDQTQLPQGAVDYLIAHPRPWGPYYLWIENYVATTVGAADARVDVEVVLMSNTLPLWQANPPR
jgi:hypothetical protein